MLSSMTMRRSHDISRIDHCLLKLRHALRRFEDFPRTMSHLARLRTPPDLRTVDDGGVMKAAAEACNECGVSHDVQVMSAHRTPDDVADYAKGAYARGMRVIIGGAGGAAHLAGVIAAFTTLPVIAVPIESKSLKGM